MDSLLAARPGKSRSAFDRPSHVTSFLTVPPSAAHERLYGDSLAPGQRSARAGRDRERKAAFRPTPNVRPEGLDLILERPDYFKETAREEKFKEKAKETARGRDDAANPKMSKKKADFGGGHPMWSPYYSPTGKTKVTTYSLQLLLLLLLPVASSFYLPGVYPRSYKPTQQVPLFVNSLTSTKTILPKDVYRHQFCRPRTSDGKKDNIKHEKENLGEFLTGDSIENSPYK